MDREGTNVLEHTGTPCSAEGDCHACTVEAMVAELTIAAELARATLGGHGGRGDLARLRSAVNNAKCLADILP